MRKLIIILLVIPLLGVISSSCTKEETLGPSIFSTVDSLDQNSVTYDFDNWLKESYLQPYNLDFRYKLQDVGSDMSYNLVPVSLPKAKDMAKLVKYLWFDAYAAVVGQEFLRENGPKIIHLIGSPAYNPVSGTILLGTAEGGIKVTLYSCNDLNPNDIAMLNEYYFKTMHHEFAHILHQKKNYPIEFAAFSKGNYNPLGWQTKSDSEAASQGFVSPYASSQVKEDFVEVIANYLVKSDADWNNLLDMASKPGINKAGTTLPDDGINGKAVILSKLDMATKWLKNSWNLDIVQLRAEIMAREANINEILK
ncbi:MAG: putative zinc-binding metallopeptidase [Bacteroidales bacterium]|nr:putative zinc-binding metallopeptidase [Bacteroidales bacterium]